MLDLLNETVEKPVIFSHEAQVLDLAFQRWVHPAFVDIWRGEVLGELQNGAKISPKEHKFDFRKISTRTVDHWIISFVSTALQVPLGQQRRAIRSMTRADSLTYSNENEKIWYNLC